MNLGEEEILNRALEIIIKIPGCRLYALRPDQTDGEDYDAKNLTS